MEYESSSDTVTDSIFTAKRIKLSIALIIGYIITCSNMFIETVIMKFPSLMENGKVNEKGMIACIAVLLIIFFAADFAIDADLI